MKPHSILRGFIFATHIVKQVSCIQLDGIQLHPLGKFDAIIILVYLLKSVGCMVVFNYS